MKKLKLEPKDFSREEILEGMDEKSSLRSLEELEDLLNLESDEIGAYSRRTLLDMIYRSHSNEELFEMFHLWEYFHNICD